MIGRLGTLAFSLVFAALLGAATATPASADPPPWSAAYHKRNHDQRHCNDPRHHHGVQYPQYSPVGYPGYYEDGSCNKVRARIEKARAGLARWSGTGRHKKAQRAWREILAKAPQRLRECRTRQAERYYDRRYAYDVDDYYPEPEYYPEPDYDPYASGSVYGGAELDWKRDWPYLLGGLLGQYQGR